MKTLALIIAMTLSGCVAYIPIGKDGSYGEAVIGYRPPARLPDRIGGASVTYPQLFRDK